LNADTLLAEWEREDQQTWKLCWKTANNEGLVFYTNPLLTHSSALKIEPPAFLVFGYPPLSISRSNSLLAPKVINSLGIPKEVMRRSRTTRHEILRNAALLSFSVAVPDEFTPKELIGC
jgi:hypothetical protein